MRLLWAVAPGNWSDASPYRILRVSPSSIEHCTWDAGWYEDGFPRHRSHFDKDADVGRVIDGDWDTRVVRFEDGLTFRLIRERYARGVPWEATEVFQFFRRRVEAGAVIWHGCASMRDLLARAQRVDRLFDSIERRGYRRQWQIRPGSSGTWLDEITVNVGRRGQLLHNNSGAHRLAIAKVLGLDHVFVRVLVRHRQWQDVRDNVRGIRNPEPPGRTAGSLLAHPDLRDITPSRVAASG